MGYVKSDLDDIKENLKSLIGEEILIVEPVSRRGKKMGKVATLENTYSTYFRVLYDDDKYINYNYSDIFTKDIRVQTFDGDKFNPLDVPRPLTKKETIPTLNLDKPDLEYVEVDESELL